MSKPRTSISGKPSTGGLVILGLLLDVPRSGYDLIQVIERSIGQFWPMTKAHVYGELPRLESAGFVEGERVAQQGVPDKVIFSLTDSGRTTFQRWITSADLGAPRLHHPLLLKLFFATEMPREAVTTLLEEREREIHRALAGYRDLMRASLEKGFSPRQWTLRYGILRLEAELVFLSEVRENVANGPTSAAAPTKKGRRR